MCLIFTLWCCVVCCALVYCVLCVVCVCSFSLCVCACVLCVLGIDSWSQYCTRVACICFVVLLVCYACVCGAMDQCLDLDLTLCARAVSMTALCVRAVSVVMLCVLLCVFRAWYHARTSSYWSHDSMSRSGTCVA